MYIALHVVYMHIIGLTSTTKSPQVSSAGEPSLWEGLRAPYPVDREPATKTQYEVVA